MIKILLTFLFSVALAEAATIQAAKFDSSTQMLELVLTYQGGELVHSFSLDWDQCTVINGENQIAARLIDSGYNDTGTLEQTQVVSFDLSTLTCKPAELTILSDRYSRATLWIE